MGMGIDIFDIFVPSVYLNSLCYIDLIANGILSCPYICNNASIYRVFSTISVLITSVNSKGTKKD